MIDNGLAIATRERDQTAGALAAAESAAATSQGAAHYSAEQLATGLRATLVHTEATVARLTLDPIKRLRRGLASYDEISAAIDMIVFSDADAGGAEWCGFNVSAANNSALLDALSIAIARLSQRERAAAMTHSRYRSSQIPRDPTSRRMVW
jgi:hypothetical protein